MIEFWDSALVLLLLLGASGLGLFVQPFLSDRHRSRETTEVIQLIVTMLVTFAALVLGLLTTSAKVSFDTVGNDVRGLATNVIQLDRLLEEYGPDADDARQTLRIYTAAAIASTWTKEPKPPGTYYPRELPITATDAPIESTTLGDVLRQVEVRIRALQPIGCDAAAAGVRLPRSVPARRPTALEADRGSAQLDLHAVLCGAGVLAGHRVRQLRP